MTVLFLLLQNLGLERKFRSALCIFYCSHANERITQFCLKCAMVALEETTHMIDHEVNNKVLCETKVNMRGQRLVLDLK